MKKGEQEYYEKLLNKFKQDPMFDLRVELGNMLMRDISSFTPQERKRYDELIEILSDNPNINS